MKFTLKDVPLSCGPDEIMIYCHLRNTLRNVLMRDIILFLLEHFKSKYKKGTLGFKVEQCHIYNDIFCNRLKVTEAKLLYIATKSSKSNKLDC